MKKILLTSLLVLASNSFAQPVAKITFNNFFVGTGSVVELYENGSVVATSLRGPSAVRQTLATISLKNMEVLNQKLSELFIEEEAEISDEGPICMDYPSTSVEVLQGEDYKTVYIDAMCKTATEPSYKSNFAIQMAGSEAIIP